MALGHVPDCDATLPFRKFVRAITLATENVSINWGPVRIGPSAAHVALAGKCHSAAHFFITVQIVLTRVARLWRWTRSMTSGGSCGSGGGGNDGGGGGGGNDGGGCSEPEQNSSHPEDHNCHDNQNCNANQVATAAIVTPVISLQQAC